MTQPEFEFTILPFINLYWKQTHYHVWPKDQEFRLGQMVFFCSKTYIPDAVIFLNEQDDIVDGFFVCGYNTWKGEKIKTKLEELGVWLMTHHD